MKNLTLSLAAAAALLVGATAANADDTTPVQRGPVAAFVDANNDGINDNAPDHDGDGIVNHADPDYQPLGLGRGRGAKGQFVDENGDGINDLAPDDDLDGIPNGQDPDFVRQGSGRRGGQGAGRGSRGAARAFVDADGDGICDNAQDSDGDGTINCLDPDFTQPVGAQGQGRGKGQGWQGGGRGAR